MRGPVVYRLDVSAAWRTARKRHVCESERIRPVNKMARRNWWTGDPLPAGHTATIEPGDNYLEILEFTPAFQSGDRACEACAYAAGFTEGDPNES